jgi:cytochrome c oxidase subunit 2
MILLTFLTVSTLYLVILPLTQKTFNKFYMEGQELEVLWTILPVFMLFFVAIPSIKVLYLIEESKSPSITTKVVGHQWYWSYESKIIKQVEKESFIEPSTISRLLKSTEGLVIPFYWWTRLVVTSTDVIHSWTIPSIGVKADALPGRLNQLTIFSKRPGLFLGQCSEICGANHSFIPTHVLVSTIKSYE